MNRRRRVMSQVGGSSMGRVESLSSQAVMPSLLGILVYNEDTSTVSRVWSSARWTSLM